MDQATRYYLGEGYGVGYIDPEHEANETLRTLQQQIIEVVNPLPCGTVSSIAGITGR